MTPSSPISGPLSVGELLDRSFRLYRANFASMAGLAALLLAPIGILSAFTTGQFMVRYFDMLERIVSSVGEPDFGETFVPLFSSGSAMFFVFAVSWVVTSLAMLSLTHQAISGIGGEQVGIRAGLRAGVRRLPAYLWMSFVRFAVIGLSSMIVVVAAVLGFVLVVGVMEALFRPSNFSGAGELAFVFILVMVLCLYVVALFLIFLPLLYFMARWIAVTPGMLEQGWGPIEALRMSWRLTRGRVWRAFGYYFLLSLLSVLVVGLPLSVVQQILTLVLLESPVMASTLGGVIGAVFSVLWNPIYAAALTFLYYDLRVRNESYDLTLRIEQMEAEAQGMDQGLGHTP